MEESEFENFHFYENLYDRREQDRHEDRISQCVPTNQKHEPEDHETVVKIEEAGEPEVSVEPAFQGYPDVIQNPHMTAFPIIPGPSVQPVTGPRELVPMYQGAVKLSFGREIILGPSKKFGTKNQTSYRIVTLSKYECDVCQFSYVGENVNKLKGMDRYQLFTGSDRLNLIFTVVFTASCEI